MVCLNNCVVVLGIVVIGIICFLKRLLRIISVKICYCMERCWSGVGVFMVVWVLKG